MGTRLIATIWLVGTLVMIAGGAAMLAAAPTDNTGGSLHGHPVAATAVLLVSSGVAVTGFTLQLAAWIGALINTHQLARKTWFYVLLWVGTAGLVTSPLLAGGIIWWNLMLIYLLTAPDGKLAHTPDSPRPQPRSGRPPRSRRALTQVGGRHGHCHRRDRHRPSRREGLRPRRRRAQRAQTVPG